MELKTYIRVFAKNEFISVVSGGRKFILLILIASVSLWSIGFSSGASRYLKTKMDSPFVKFLKVDIPFQLAQKQSYIDELEKVMALDKLKSSFDVHGISLTSFTFESFYIKENKASVQGVRKSETAKIQMMTADNPMYAFMKSDGLFKNDQYLDLSNAPHSIVVTEEYLRTLGYLEQFPAFLDFRFRGVGNEEFSVPIGIAGVVSQLPNKCDILCTEKLFPHITGFTEYSILDPNATAHLNEFIIYTEEPINTKKTEVYELDSQGLVQQTIRTGKSYYVFPTDDKANWQELESELTKIIGQYRRVYNFNSIGQSDTTLNVIYDKLVIEMSSLEKVNQLREMMLSINKNFKSLSSDQKKIAMVIDMDVIESRNNFVTFNSVSRVLSRVLVLISIGFIIVIVIQTLLQHINKNAKNIGTLKAFGMSNRVIGLTYVLISFVIIAIVYLSAAGILFFAADFTTEGVLRMVKLDTGGDSLYNFRVLLTYLPFFTVLPLVIVGLTIWLKIRNETPGDLIYER